MKTSTNVFSKATKIALSFFFMLAFMAASNAQINVSGGNGLASSYTSFTKSTGLFAALNATTQSGAITVNITGDVTDEDGATSLNEGAWSGITVTPSGVRTISGSVAGHLLNFNGADKVTINGLTLSGANSLTISNNSTNALSSAIRFINDATYNTITNCTIKAAGGNSTSTGAIFFSTATTTGNDNNTISNNNITASTIGSLSNGIYSLGTSVAKSNDNNTVSGNNIYDYFMVDSNCAAVFVGINNSSWTISNNRIYQTAERQYNAANVLYAFYGINVHTNALQDGFTISGNTIGGNNSAGSGQLRISSISSSQRFCGIQLSAGTNATSTISNNTIANIYNSSFAASFQPFANVCGIAAIAGNINVTNNTIGATSGASGSLYAYVRASSVSAGVMGIYTAGAAPAVQTVSNNTIGSLVAKDSLISYSSCVYGMYINGASSSITINNNTVGNSTANNMVAGSASTTASSVVMGVYMQSSPLVVNCYSNTVQNLAAFGSTGTGTYVRGIGTATSTSSAYIYNNTINNLTTNGIVPNIGSGSAAAAGIVIGASTSTFSYSAIYGNTITNISSTNATANTSSVIVAGIVHASAASNIAIYKNTINSLSNAGTGITAVQPPIIAGIVMMNSTTTDSIYNNMISLGTGLTTNTVIAGIWAQHSGTGVATDYILHNTVNIAGTQTSGIWSSFCFHRGDFNAAVATSKQNAVVIKNNIFTNSRTGGTGTSSQGHYAISNNFASTVAGATTLGGWSSNFNILNSASTTTVGWHGTAAYTFANWKAIATILPDGNSSTAATVTYTSATDLHINMGTTANVIESAGDPAVYLLSDFDGDARPGPVSPKLNGGGFNPDLGADEFDGQFTATCNGTPTAPNAQTSAASVTCYGTTVNLSLASAVTGTGISYQWQVSTTSSTTGFSNITGAVGSTYTATPATASNWYRCVITCVASGLSANTAAVAVTGPGRLSGTYTINSGAATSGTNYNSFTAAFAALNCNGISGPVVFNVNATSGPYNEQVTLNAINGASATNTITFNGNGRTLNFASTNTLQRTGITLNGASYVTFDNLKIDTIAGSVYNWGFLFINNANYNTISNCVINVGIVSIVSTNTNGIVFSSSGTAIANAGPTGNYNTITGNTIKGGYIGIAISGNSVASSTYSTGNVISNNIIRDFYNAGISETYNKNFIISGNDISRPSRSLSSSVTAISVSTGGDGIVVKNNKIHNIFDKLAATHTNQFTGIITASVGTLGNENKIFNNVMYNIAGNGVIIGIQNQSGYYQIYHNTLFFGGTTTASAATTGIQTSASTAGVDIRNNMVYISRSTAGAKRCIYVSFAPPGGIINYNNYYINTNSGADYAIGQYLSSGGLTASTLTSWQTANGGAYDANSFSVDPLFTDSTGGDFTPTSATIDEVGTPVGIITDVNGSTRSTTDPDLGAYEFASNPCTDPATPGIATTSAATACSGTSFTLGLSGTSVGSGQRYQWQDSIPGGSWNNLTASVQKLQTYTTSQTVSHWYRAIVQCNYPNGTNTYTTPIYIYTPAQLNGTYTINKSAAATTTNFTSFTSAVAALGCGITGPVTFNVLNGPYNEQVTMTAVSGASATNRIKFNGNGQTVTFAASVSTNRHTFGLNAASYITVNNLVINAATGTFGTGVWLKDATYDSITNCTINLDLIKTTSDFGGIIMSTTSNTALGGSNNSNNCAFVSNAINGGYAGIVLFGNSSINQLGNSAINNTITNAHNYGIYIVYQDGALVGGNDMYSTTRTAFNTTSYTGISFAAGTTNTTIDRNKIHNIFDAATNSTISFTGISTSGSPTLGKEHKVTNNLIYGINHDGSIIGITTLAASYNNIYHNTIILNNATTSTTNSTIGITITGAPSYNNIKNNLVYIGRGGTGTKVCVNRQQSSIFGNNIFDHNNVYLKPGLLGSNNYLAQDSTLTFTDINAWRADTCGGGDANATNIKVSFANAAVGNYSPFVQAFDNLGAYIPGVDFDINGNPRSNTTPDIGAYEFSLTNCSGIPTPGTAFSTTSNACIGDNFTFDLTGNSLGLTQTYQWQKSANGVSGWSNVGALLDYSSAELTISQTTSNYYRCKVSCSGNDAYSNILYISSPDLVSGNFTIDKNNPTIAGSTYNTFAEAISYISCGINGPVTLTIASGSGPYSEQFTIPAINGTSATNSITINGNGETLAFSSTVSTNRNGITLNGADWVTITNLNIDMSVAADSNLTKYFGTGICLTNFADNNTITGCTINAGRNTTNPNMACITITGSTGVLTAQGNAGSNNTITGCNIYGGYYGVYLYGLLNFTGSGNGNIISNNQLVDNYNAPVAVTFQSGTIVRNNEIYKTSTRTNYSSVTYGVYMSTQASSFTIEKNKIHDLYVNAATNTGATYCIYVSSSNTFSTVGSEAKVINNLVYNMISDGTTYGIYATSPYTWYFHNTIVLDYAGTATTTGATYGFYTASAANNVVKNNNFYITRGSNNANNRGLYFASGSTLKTVNFSNNNLYFSPTAGTNNQLVQFGSTLFYNTISDFQMGYTDSGCVAANNISVNPAFANAGAGNYAANSKSLTGVGATNLGVTTDILGNNRTVYFTPGAYEVDVTPPTISYTSLTASCSNGQTSNVLNGVIITDVTGVATSGANVPKIYFKKGINGSWYSAAGTKASGSSTNSTWNFTIQYSNMTGLANGDSVYYFVAAQDLTSTLNFSSSPSGAVGTVNSISAYPTANYYTIITNTPSVVITTASTSVCTGASITFTATPTNGGYLPTYQWYRNGSSISGETAATLTQLASQLNTGDNITCILTNNSLCQTTATSNSISLTVGDVTPSVSISSTSTAVCTGSSVVFTATPTNGGATPTYQWKKNGNNIGASGLQLTLLDNQVTTGDEITCVMTANNICQTTATATSNGITLTVGTGTPSISISTDTTTICSGSNTTFVANAINGGSSPSYQWKRNGFDVGSGSTITFLSNTLTNGDVIHCVLTANNTCQTTPIANSNVIHLTVKQSLPVAQITNGNSTITTASLCTLGTVVKYFNATPYGTWSSSNPTVASVTGGSQAGVVTPNMNGTATISYNIAATNGCISTSSVLVTVAQQSAPTAISGTNSICVGFTTALSSTAPIGTTGVWSSSNDRGIISVGGVYTGKNAGTWGEARYTVTNASGCKAFAAYAITVNPTPVVPTITYAPGTTFNPQVGAPTGSFCVGKKFRVVATPNVPAGVWSATGAASFAGYDTVKINAVGAGSIKYTYTSAAGCVNSRTMNATGYTCAARGVNTVDNQLSTFDGFTMYPNPAKGFINLNVETLIGAGSIVITDLYGKQVKTQNLSIGTNTVNIANLCKGMYFVSTITTEGKTTKKLVVE